jgi:hypothetical protein
MTDDLVLQDVPYRNRLNIRDKYEVRLWARHLGVSRQQLLAAALKVGNSAAAVRKELSVEES